VLLFRPVPSKVRAMATVGLLFDLVQVKELFKSNVIELLHKNSPSSNCTESLEIVELMSFRRSSSVLKMSQGHSDCMDRVSAMIKVLTGRFLQDQNLIPECVQYFMRGTI
jgi:hypothetical protein